MDTSYDYGHARYGMNHVMPRFASWRHGNYEKNRDENLIIFYIFYSIFFIM